MTIVIATYNAAEFLPATLASIEAQSRGALARTEVVLVDGGSHDESVSLAEASAVVTRIVAEPDEGIYDAMNKGAAHARGRWLHFLNAGDTFTGSDSLQVALQTMEEADKASHVWMVAGAQNMGGARGQRRRIPNLPHRWWRHAFGLQPHCHQATWFRKDIFCAAGGYSLRFGLAGDFDLILRVGLIGRPMERQAVLIDYLGGGVSEKQGHLVPSLLHQIRIERLNLSGYALAVDRAFGRAVVFRNRAKTKLGAMKATLHCASPRK